MVTMLRRLFWLGLIGGAGYAGWTLWQRRAVPPPAAAPEWPPMPPPEAPAAPDSAATTGASEQPASGDRRWVEPVDGGCPDGHPIKANANSGIYHVPGGRFYARTLPERCYVDPAAAEADGYRAAKA